MQWLAFFFDNQVELQEYISTLSSMTNLPISQQHTHVTQASFIFAYTYQLYCLFTFLLRYHWCKEKWTYSGRLEVLLAHSGEGQAIQSSWSLHAHHLHTCSYSCKTLWQIEPTSLILLGVDVLGCCCWWRSCVSFGQISIVLYVQYTRWQAMWQPDVICCWRGTASIRYTHVINLFFCSLASSIWHLLSRDGVKANVFFRK